jgi:hypothetical protein
LGTKLKYLDICWVKYGESWEHWWFSTISGTMFLVMGWKTGLGIGGFIRKYPKIAHKS